MRHFRAPLALSFVLALGGAAWGCIDDDSPPPPALALPEAGAIDTPPLPDSGPITPPPPGDASASGFSAGSTAAGGVVTKSESYRLVTRTGGSPGSGVPAVSESFKTKPTLPGKNKP